MSDDDDDTSSNGSPANSDHDEEDSNQEEEDSKPPALPRPRTRVTRASSDNSQMEALLSSLPPGDKEKLIAADTRRKDGERNTLAAHSHLLEVKSELHQVQRKLEKAQNTYDQAVALSQENSGQDADALSLAPSEWNSRYQQLKAYFIREGHSHLKKIISDADVEGVSDTEAAEIRALSRWTFRQRKLKRNGDLEYYKVILMERLKFDWNPKAGHGPDKWLKNYNLLKEFKEQHGHLEVPTQQGENKLALWVKTQLTLYRNGKAGKLPALSDERIRLLEELDITWGVRRKVIPWEDQFQELMDYKRRFGNVNVPWQWKENNVLAQWVNTQRKKYKDLIGGKKSSLTEEQLNKLNSVGFKWSNGRKGRYPDDSQDQPSAKKARTSEEAESFIKLKSAAAAAGIHAPSASSSSAEDSARANMLQSFAAQASAKIQNTPSSFLSSLSSGGGGFGTNQQTLLPQASAASSPAMQLLTQKLTQQRQGNLVGAQQASTLQQLLNNNQLPSYARNPYQQLLSSQQLQPMSNIAFGTSQAPQNEHQQLLNLINQRSQSITNSTEQLLRNACQIITQPIQPPSSTAVGALQAPPSDLANHVAARYQQLLDLVNQGGPENTQPDQSREDAKQE